MVCVPPARPKGHMRMNFPMPCCMLRRSQDDEDPPDEWVWTAGDTGKLVLPPPGHGMGIKGNSRNYYDAANSLLPYVRVAQCLLHPESLSKTLSNALKPYFPRPVRCCHMCALRVARHTLPDPQYMNTAAQGHNCDTVTAVQ